MKQRQSVRYRRRDIQALRALAVSAVFANHLTDRPVGGFLGVDVFFVVSGFLITGLLLREHRTTGRIALVAFAIRRIVRLAPAAFLVLLATVALSVFVFSPSRLASISVDAVWAALAAANWRFSTDGTDYFAAAWAISPLQHYWSLAVEEQFYLVWPLLLVLLLFVGGRVGGRGRGAILVLGIAAVTLGSFVVALDLTADHPSEAYFSTFARVWELGAGALLAVVAPCLARIPHFARLPLRLAGLAGILASFLLIPASFPVPGPWSLAPVAATILVIAAGTGRDSASLRPIPLRIDQGVVALGDMSYSLYLWHFPVIVLLESSMGRSVWIILPATALTFALSLATYRLVERPLIVSPIGSVGRGIKSTWRDWRRSVRATYRRGLPVVAAGVTIVATAAGLFIAHPPQPPTLPEQTASDAALAQREPERAVLRDRIIASLRASTWPDVKPSMETILANSYATDLIKGSPEGKYYRCSTKISGSEVSPDCLFGPRNAPRLAFVLGDSMAAFEFPGLGQFAEASGSKWKIQNASKVSCPIGDNTDTSEECLKHRAAVEKAIRATHPDVVFISNIYGDSNDPEKERASHRAIAGAVSRIARYTEKIVLLAPPPSQNNIRNCFTRFSTPSSCLSRVTDGWKARARFESALARSLGGVWIDSRPLYCAYDLCPAIIGTTPVRYDFNHLTPEAAHLTSPALIETLNDAGVLD